MRRDWVCDRSLSDKLVCTTSAYRPAAAAAAGADDDDDDRQGLISLMIDGMQIDLNHTLFTYTEDPVITDVQPATSFITFVDSSRAQSSNNLTTKSKCWTSCDCWFKWCSFFSLKFKPLLNNLIINSWNCIETDVAVVECEILLMHCFCATSDYDDNDYRTFTTTVLLHYYYYYCCCCCCCCC